MVFFAMCMMLLTVFAIIAAGCLLYDFVLDLIHDWQEKHEDNKIGR